MIEIAVKFKDLNNSHVNFSTAVEHMNVCSQYGAVIWGAWCATDKKMSIKRYQSLNQSVPFTLWALDKKASLLKMRVRRVLTKDEIIAEQLEYLIPAYYGLETTCAVYYLVDEISVNKAENAQFIFTNNGVPLFNSNQIPSNAPWNVVSKEFPVIDLIKGNIDPTTTPKTNKHGIALNDVQKERNKMSDGLRYKVLKRDNFKCRYCGRSVGDNVKLHIDHIIPVSKGGKTTLDNLQVLCEECNLGKSDS